MKKTSKLVLADFSIESALWEQGFLQICGVDEVGRGCFAGPVVAGAVIFSPDCNPPDGIADSKLLKPIVRETLTEQIKNCALAWAVGEVSVAVINQVGIGRATQLAFVKAIENLTHLPDRIMIDAFYIADLAKEMQYPIQGGDKLSTSIAAASIVAKVYRDDLMKKLGAEYPEYGFSIHKGYGTKLHQAALKKHGLSPLHRTSFNLSKFSLIRCYSREGANPINNFKLVFD